MRPERESSSSSSFGGEFAPGEILIGRYRVIALVGEGGMGQVYLSDDLVLGPRPTGSSARASWSCWRSSRW